MIRRKRSNGSQIEARGEGNEVILLCVFVRESSSKASPVT